MAWKTIMRADDLWGGEMVGVRIEGRALLLVNVDGQVRAYEDRCLHLGMPLSRGKLSGPVLVCSAHRWEYDVCTGRGINPEGITLRSFAVQIADGAILVDVDGG